MSVVVAGIIGLDRIKTPHSTQERLLGGSGSYAAMASSFFSATSLIGVVGGDFPYEHFASFRQMKIDLSGVQILKCGKTFRWSGEYYGNMNRRRTLDTELGVVGSFKPDLRGISEPKPIILLAAMSPETQLETLTLCREPKFVISDTMDHWISTKKEALSNLLEKIDLFAINDSEAKQFSGESNLIVAGDRILSMGPKFVLIKKGEHGALLFGPEKKFFSVSAYPLRSLLDPTGAGDSFIGAIAGYLGASQRPLPIHFEDLCRALDYGAAVAAFNCESFSTLRLECLTRPNIDSRVSAMRSYTQIT